MSLPYSSTLSVDVELIVEDGVVPAISAPQVIELVPEILRREGASGRWVVSVVLTSDDHLRRLHADFMGIDEETDVMTFPFEPGLGESARGGDIVISAGRAAEQAVEFGHTAGEEVRFLVVHGLLHLCGWKDETAEQRTVMLARQDELIADVEASAMG